MTRRSPVRIAAALGLFIALTLLAAPTRAETPDPPETQATTTTVTITGTAPPAPPVALIKFGDSSLRLGTVLQARYDASEDPNTSGYTQNFYMRRARFFMLGKLGKQVGPGVNEVEFFFQTDNPRAGNASAPPASSTGAKNTGTTGLIVQDAYAQWAFGGNAIALQAGLWIVPTVRPLHTSVATYLWDTADYSLQQNTVLQGIGARDYGVGFNGYLLDDHFSYRVGVFSGLRQAASNQPAPLGQAASGRNSLRYAGRFMYDFFDSEKGYTYMGTYLGRKKVVAIAAVVDGQGSYEGYGGDAFVDWPVGPGAVTFEADYLHYSGWGKFYSGIPEQQQFFANAGYYFDAAKLQPFVLFEKLTYHAATNAGKEQERVGGGLNYYVMWQNFKITAYYERTMPKVQPATAKIKDTNRFVIQIQTFL